MFKLPVEELQKNGVKVVNAARRSRLVNNPIFVTSSKEKQTVTLSFVGEILSVEKTIETVVTEDVSFATSILEFNLKVGTLPADEEVEFIYSPNKNIILKWGRNSGIILHTIKTDKVAITIPEIENSISVPPGKWHYITRNFIHFAALPNSEAVKKCASSGGVHFAKGDNGVLIQATNSARAIKAIEELDWFDTALSIPSEVMHSVAELIDSKQIITVSLSNTKTQIVIEGDNVIAIARILDGTFPDTNAMFSNKSANVIWRADRLELLETTRRVKRLDTVTPTNPKLMVFKKDTKHFAVLKDVLTEQISAVVESEEEHGFYVGALDLEAALTVLRSEEVLIAFEGPKKPITLLCEDEEGNELENIKVMIAQMKY